MLEALIGSTTSEKALIYLTARSEGYMREIADFFDIAPAPLLRQLDKLETGGILYSKSVGRTRVFGFNPRYPFLAELQALLAKALSFYPDDVRQRLEDNRRRPRRKGKPL
ncbi:winged helix-turn-helix transcriptional regulator [Oryzomonas japonica]|uniref:Winged helix-turn-helix transcriptional regulator n=1 Tax=Oryzomonas japonica TaxID=2603858 RepID=A0A7J4ZN54_9BACT|nr:winged helix-turn-helix domain-containing protein [Oryzomonas japonica]KAB0663992.1 winged helix-turn-helix transcriptional regulator [Oryzomonas japonica]